MIQAAGEGHIEVVKELLKVHDINVNHANNDGNSALINAAGEGHIEIVQELLKVDGINVNHANNDGNSALINAASEGHTEIVQELLKVDGINVNHSNYHRWSALINAASEGYTKIVQDLLLVDGINVNQDNSYGNTALIEAVEKGHSDIVQDLLQVYGINVNHGDNNDWSALMHAADKGHITIVQDLLKVRDIDVNHAADMLKLSYDMLKSLGMNSDHAPEYNESALTLAAGKGHTEIVKELLKAPGINVNYATKDNQTAMWCASQQGHLEIVKALVVAGVDLSIASSSDDNKGKTAIDVAKTEEIKQVLRNAPAIKAEAIRKQQTARKAKEAEEAATSNFSGLTAEQVGDLVKILGDDYEDLKPLFVRKGLTGALIAQSMDDNDLPDILKEVGVTTKLQSKAIEMKLRAFYQPSKSGTVAITTSVSAAVNSADRSGGSSDGVSSSTPSVGTFSVQPGAFADFTSSALKILRREIDLQSKISSGATSTVHKGTWRGTNVAVKILRADRGDKAYKVLERELSILIHVRHDRVVNLMGVCDDLQDIDGGNVALITQLMGRGSLYYLLHNQSATAISYRPQSLEMRLQLSKDIAEAMRFLHASRIFHRDLKSGNVLVDNDGRAKVADFGMSAFNRESMSQVTAALGTMLCKLNRSSYFINIYNHALSLHSYF